MNGRIAILSSIERVEGYRCRAVLPAGAPLGEAQGSYLRSELRLFENGVELGPGHCMHDEISAQGLGRFSHWGNAIFFSASDNSDPTRNGREYAILYAAESGQPKSGTQVPMIDPARLSSQQAARQGDLAFKRDRIVNVRDITLDTRLAFKTSVPTSAPEGDGIEDLHRSALRLFEQGVELGPAHALHSDIRELGGGRYSHWGAHLLFSSSDGSDPRTNGREYLALFSEGDTKGHATLRDCLNIDFESLDDSARYLCAERAFNAIVPYERLADFSRIMFKDEEFLADYERFDTQNYRTFDRKFAVRELLKLVLPLEGELAECGVFRGATAFIIAKEMAKAAPGKKLHLFDSFAGLSDPKPQLDGSYWAAGSMFCSLTEVERNLEPHRERVAFHPGWIPERFSDVQDVRFCFVHVDVDLFEPSRDSLAFFGPRMVPGGVIVCDDYGFETCPGARKAMDAHAAEIGLPVIHFPTGQGVIFYGR